MARVRGAIFKFKPFSQKQKKILTWWLPESALDSRIINGSDYFHPVIQVARHPVRRTDKSLILSTRCINQDVYKRQITGIYHQIHES